MAAKFSCKKYKLNEVLEAFFALPSDDESMDDTEEGDGEITLPSSRGVPNIDDIEPKTIFSCSWLSPYGNDFATCKFDQSASGFNYILPLLVKVEIFSNKFFYVFRLSTVASITT